MMENPTEAIFHISIDKLAHCDDLDIQVEGDTTHLLVGMAAGINYVADQAATKAAEKVDLLNTARDFLGTLVKQAEEEAEKEAGDQKGKEKDFQVSVESKNGEMVTNIVGDTFDVLGGLTYLAIRVCALAGQTPESRRAVLEGVINALSTSAEDVESMYKTIKIDEAVKSVERIMKGRW